MEKFHPLIIGTTGITANEVVQNMPLDQFTPTHDTASLIIQIVIALATLLKMFKKPKEAI